MKKIGRVEKVCVKEMYIVMRIRYHKAMQETPV